MKKLSGIIFFLITLLVLFFTATGKHGVLHLQKINNEVAILEEENRRLESEILDLKNKIYAIQNSDEAIEKAAREELGLSKPGEVVYIFPKKYEN